MPIGGFLCKNEVKLRLIPILFDLFLQSVQEIVKFLLSLRDSWNTICRALSSQNSGLHPCCGGAMGKIREIERAKQ